MSGLLFFASDFPSITSNALKPLEPLMYVIKFLSITNYAIPRLLKKFGERAFSYAGLTAWNSLPHELRATLTLNSFKCKLKTLFNTAFNR